MAQNLASNPDERQAGPAVETGSRRLFDLAGASNYIRQLGGTGVTTWTLRRLVSSGELRSLKLGRKIFVTREALDNLLVRLERRLK